MTKRRKLLIAFAASSLIAPAIPFAQLQGKVWRIGFLGADSAPDFVDRLEALRAGLRDLGYVEGKNIVVEYRYAEGKRERLQALAIELARLNVDVLVCHATPGTQAVKEATSTIPVVVTHSGDLVGMGLVASLARPGGNITGSTFFSPELMAKRLELLRDALPRLTRVGVLINPDNASNPSDFKEVVSGAKAMKLTVQQFDARTASEIGTAFSEMAKSRISAALIFDDSMFIARAREIAELASKQRLPAIGSRDFANAGGLMGYDANRIESWRRAAAFIDKILKGAKPGDLPIERATRFDLVVNLNTARAFDLTIPQSVLVRADRVID